MNHQHFNNEQLRLKLRFLENFTNSQSSSCGKKKFVNRTWYRSNYVEINSVGNSPTTSAETSPETSPVNDQTTFNNWLQNNNTDSQQYCRSPDEYTEDLTLKFHQIAPRYIHRPQPILPTNQTAFIEKGNRHPRAIHSNWPVNSQKSLKNTELLNGDHVEHPRPLLSRKQNLKKKALKANHHDKQVIHQEQRVIHKKKQILHQEIQIIHHEQKIINEEQQVIKQEHHKEKIIAPRGRPISGCEFPVIVRPDFTKTTEFSTIIDSKKDVLDDDSFESLLCRPWGVTVNKDGQIIVCDRTNHRIIVFLEDGTVFKKFGEHGSLPGQFKTPAGLAVDVNQRLIIVDKENHRVQIMTLDGDFILTFGEQGSGPGQFHYPWDVAVNDNCEMVISDTRNNRIQLFNSEGLFLREFGYGGTKETRLFFDLPRGVAFNRDGNVVMTDFNNNKIVVISYDFSSAQVLENDEITFLRPQGIIVDDSGHIIVTESRGNKIQILDRDGTLVWKFDTSIGSGSDKINYPTGVALTPSGKILFADCNNNRILLI